MREVIITKDSNLIDLDTLAQNPIVRKCWRLAKGYTLIEPYDPVLDDPRISSAARHKEPLKSQLNAFYSEQAKLLAPLYEHVKPSDAGMALIPGTRTVYRFLGRDKLRIRWPEIGCSRGWESANTVRISGRLVAAIPETIQGLNTVLKEWLDSMAAVSQIRLVRSMAFADRDFTLIAEFADACGDAAMALYILLTETRGLTSLEAVGFFLPDDFSSPFVQIGGPGKSHQRARRHDG